MADRGDMQAAATRSLPRAVDAVVVGAGHAGVEAAWALARLGHRVALVSFDMRGIARMSCNPAVGGLAKGQLAREIDALGGLMGRLIDRTGIHFRMLNRRKGPAVHAPRAQADREGYAAAALAALSALPHLELIEAEVTEIVVENAGGAGTAAKRRVVGVRLDAPAWASVRPGGAHSDGPVPAGRGAGGDPPRGVLRIDAPCELAAAAVVLTVGTFLRALLFTGADPRPGGRRGEPPARRLSTCLEQLGLVLGRLKTGTPPRLTRASVDFSRLAVQPGDEPPPRFSFYETGEVRNRVVCHLTHTNEMTHRIIRGALDRSPLYGGLIRGIGPRYCPSIEDKVVRFPERESHQVFLEPEGFHSDTMYPNGISTSLPEDVQVQYVHTIPGLEQARIVHPGYAVEYDFLNTTQIDGTLQVRGIDGLYAAGQINGTSGYEEAAAQGLMAGINLHARLTGRGPVVLGRNEAYIGVLVDDLITKVPTEPYRMFTSQSEYRLLLRQDNADQRLAPLGRELGLVDEDEWQRVAARSARVATARAELRSRHGTGNEAAAPGAGADEAHRGRTLEDLLRRPDVDLGRLEQLGYRCDLPEEDRATLEAEVKYEGYIRKQSREILRARDLEERLIPAQLLDDPPEQLSREARDRLHLHRPHTLGQAIRLQGITRNDLLILAVHMRAFPRVAAAPANRATGQAAACGAPDPVGPSTPEGEER